MSNDVQFQSLDEVDSFAESTNSSLNYLILEASGRMMATRNEVEFCVIMSLELWPCITRTIKYLTVRCWTLQLVVFICFHSYTQ